MATRYSLVVPVYRNEEMIPDLLSALQGVDSALGGGLEVVFAVDGSPDRSLARLVELLPRTGLTAKLLEMSRNFGAFAAIRAGLTEASGPYFAVMAAATRLEPLLGALSPVRATGDAAGRRRRIRMQSRRQGRARGAVRGALEP